MIGIVVEMNGPMLVGGADMEWGFILYPRIQFFVPTGTILEIAPGFGRWTQFLLKLCKKLIVVDLAEKCIEACKIRFKEWNHIQYHVNDGKSLDMIQDESIDFVFSFDSLVHVESDVMESYVKQIAKKLKQNGYGFIHHSNLGEYKNYFSMIKKIRPDRFKQFLAKARLIEKSDHWRGYSMTATKFRQYAEQAGLYCTSQELINCGTKRLIDCISVIAKHGDSSPYLCKVLRNKNYMKECGLTKVKSELYSRAVKSWSN